MIQLGFCGDDCNYCPRYLATRSGDQDRLKEVAAIWRDIGWRDTLEPPEKIVCHGCATIEKCGFGIKDCVINKGVESCGKCGEYPCARLLGIFENNQKEAIICKDKLSTEYYGLFQRAFFSKKERLYRIHNKFNALDK